MSYPAQAAPTFQADRSPVSLTRFLGYLVAAGLVNALIAVFLLCRLPSAHAPSLRTLLLCALIYVCIAALAGMVGSWLYWRRSATPRASDPPLSFARFALANASAWVWVPAVVLLSAQDSFAAPAVAIVAAALLAAGLRKTMPAGALTPPTTADWQQRELFSDSFLTARRQSHAYIIAVCLYAAGLALHDTETLEACALLGLCAFLATWKLTLPPDAPATTKRGTGRLSRIAIAAVLITLYALIAGVGHRNRAQETAVMARARDTSRNPAGNATWMSGYESVILWPVPQKQQILAPLPAPTAPAAPHAARPLVIRFDGPYWYFQTPDTRPSPTAHQDHGTPIAADVQSRNGFPLIMEAHQTLSSSIRLAACRELQVTLLNRENSTGVINVAILLNDSSAPSQPAVYLGQQPLERSLPGHFAIKTAATSETLRFPIPAHTKIRKFNQITVSIIPEEERSQSGAKVAVDQFELLPR